MDEPGDIATHYRLDAGKPAGVMAGRRCFAAVDKRDGSRALIAVQADALRPPRAALLSRALAPVPHCMMPLDQGAGRDPAGLPAWFMICVAPPGPSLEEAPARWSEAEVVRDLLLPAAAALEALAEQNLTHRAIRPDAMCLPAGRGDGGIADDVYALGVLMLWCVLGGQVTWPDGPELLTRKLAVGSFEALAGGRPLSPSLADLLRVMLAEDPEHRPSPSLLQDPTQARARRVAQRPPQRAQRALDVGGIAAWSARELALAIARLPEAGEAVVKSGAADRWLRRILGDSQTAVALDEAVFRRGAEPEDENARSHAMLVMRAVAVLDPLAPLVWRGQALFPDGVAGLAAACLAPDMAPLAAAVEELVCHDVVTQWASPQPRRRAELLGLVQQAKDWRRVVTMRGPMGGLRRLAYTLNPLLACASPLLEGRVAIKLPALLPALEAASARAPRQRPPIDAHVVAFVAAHADNALLTQLGGIDGFTTDKERLAVLGLFARLQQLHHPAPLPGLAGWLLESGLVALGGWRNLRTRKALGDALAAAAQAGQIPPMLQLLRNDGARESDTHGGDRAAARVATIVAQLAALRASGPARAAEARRTGLDVAAGLGLIATIAAASLVALRG
jgi:hypothetical protein